MNRRELIVARCLDTPTHPLASELMGGEEEEEDEEVD